MSLESWVTYVVTLSAVSVSPGTGAAAVMANGLTYGARGAFPVVLGLQLGLVVYALVVASGLAAVVGHGPILVALKLAGIAYLAWLGLRALSARGVLIEVHRATARRSWLARFSEGGLVNLTNPKTTVFMAALFPQFLDIGAPLLPQLGLLLCTLLAIDIAVMMGYAHLAAALRDWIRDPRRIAWMNRGLGAWFLVLASLLALEL
ncbi:MAG: LysE family transporter [Burkholderiales bacterium]